MKNRLSQILLNDNFILLILSNKRKKSQKEKRCELRPIYLKEKKLYQLTTYESNKVFHKNIEDTEVLKTILLYIQNLFKQINIYTMENDIQILANKIENPKIITLPPTKERNHPKLSHNIKKQYIIEDEVVCDFLVYLGIMNEEGKVLKSHYNKFKQINRFLEIIRDSIKDSKGLFDNKEGKPVNIIDFGCGKAYLTFAIYYYLVKILNIKANILGIDLKEDVIEFCNKVAKDLNYEGLKFQVGDIAKYKTKECDIVVSLHACDTATDYGLINAVSWNSKIILAVPCCQHELFNQIDNKLLNPILKHGINKDKFTELLTNGLRGLKLESAGYKVSMVEFTSLEHTAKNVVIKAIKTNKNKKNRIKALEEYSKLKETFNVQPSIDKL